MADGDIGGAGASGAGAGGNTGGGAQHDAAGGGQQPVAGAGGSGGTGEKGFTFKEDRSDWLPRTRLNEVTGKYTEAEKRAIKAEADLATERNRTRALAGLEPDNPKAAETEEIRSAILTMFPELGALKGLTKEQLAEVLDAAQTARSSSQASWSRHANTMLTDLDAEAATGLGVDKLTPTQQSGLRRAYREEANAAVQARIAAVKRGERDAVETNAADDDFVARHERGDKGLIKEFVKSFLGDWYEPARRSVTAAQARRNIRPIPRGERTRLPVASGAAKINYNDPAAFKKALMDARGLGLE